MNRKKTPRGDAGGQEREAYRRDPGAQGAALLCQPKGAERALDRPAAPAHQLAITLLLLPVFYSISVLDLKIAKWEPGKH